MKDSEEICRVKNSGEVGLIPATRRFLADAEARRLRKDEFYSSYRDTAAIDDERRAWLRKLAGNWPGSAQG